jgi:hypothetical protein
MNTVAVGISILLAAKLMLRYRRKAVPVIRLQRDLKQQQAEYEQWTSCWFKSHANLDRKIALDLFKSAAIEWWVRQRDAHC